MTAAQSRPRLVEAAFWCWLTSATSLVLLGLVMALSQENLPFFFRGAGALFAVAGLALGYLAGRARSGNAALRRAALGLAFALVLVLAMFTLMTAGALWLIPMILTMVGGVLMLRPSALAWFDQKETQ